MKLCARCCHKFDDDPYKSLCRECYEEACPYGDTVSIKMWGAMSVLINTKYSMQDLKSLADSKSWQNHTRETLREMDITTRTEFLRKLINDAKGYVE